MSDKDSVHSKSDNDEDTTELTIANDLVVTKYSMAGDIVNAVLTEILARMQTTPYAMAGEICDFGDRLLAERVAKVFKKEKDLKKGIAFPTCVSVNQTICHYSPLRSETDVQLKAGDLAKVDVGVHIDGFIATAAHTIVLAPEGEKVEGRKADVVWAAYNAMETAIRMLRPKQHKNTEITDVIQRVGDAYKCKPVENMLSHQLKRNRIDGEKQIIQNPGEKQRQEIEKIDIEQHEVYAIDVLMSTGEGKARELDTRTTVYKKANDLIYNLKMKTSRTFLSEAVNRFGSMPFTLRAFEDERKAKMGVVECERHGLMTPYQVLYEREGELVAQFKSTVLVMPNGLIKVAGLPAPPAARYVTQHRIEDETLAHTLASSLKPSKKKPKKTAGGPPGGEAPRVNGEPNKGAPAVAVAN